MTYCNLFIHSIFRP